MINEEHDLRDLAGLRSHLITAILGPGLPEVSDSFRLRCVRNALKRRRELLTHYNLDALDERTELIFRPLLDRGDRDSIGLGLELLQRLRRNGPQSA